MKFLADGLVARTIRQARVEYVHTLTHVHSLVPLCGESPRGLSEKRQVSFPGSKAGGPLCRKQWKKHVDRNVLLM